jgi:hypothetical protein
MIVTARNEAVSADANQLSAIKLLNEIQICIWDLGRLIKAGSFDWHSSKLVCFSA